VGTTAGRGADGLAKQALHHIALFLTLRFSSDKRLLPRFGWDVRANQFTELRECFVPGIRIAETIAENTECAKDAQ